MGSRNEYGKGWSREELEAAVEAYLEMQRKERGGESFVKKRYYEDLSSRYNRSEKSFEFRMQNISFVLSLHGREWLNGLRPARHVGINIIRELEEILADAEGRPVDPSVDFEAKVRSKMDEGKAEERPEGKVTPDRRNVLVTLYDQDPSVKAWVIIHANGICESCGRPAPFCVDGGVPFLEVHHVRRLADGGADTIENAVAVCPNCHRELHFGDNRKEMVERLCMSISRLSG